MYMPPKAKKKRASLKLDPASGQIKGDAASEEVVTKEKEPTVRQVVEVVEEGNVPEALDTIKKDVVEIEDAVDVIEEEVKKTEDTRDDVEALPKAPTMNEEVVEESKANVESIFTKSESGINPGINPEITVVGKKSAPLGVWIGAMLGVALAIGASLILLVRGPATLPFFAAKPTPTPTETPVPTPSPITVSKSDIKVAVVNGGGTPGAGSKMKTFLEEKGYIVVNVGNAKEYTYTQTEVLVKNGKEEYAKLLIDDLKVDYALGTSSAVVEAGAAYDAQVIVGKEE